MRCLLFALVAVATAESSFSAKGWSLMPAGKYNPLTTGDTVSFVPQADSASSQFGGAPSDTWQQCKCPSSTTYRCSTTAAAPDSCCDRTSSVCTGAEGKMSVAKDELNFAGSGKALAGGPEWHTCTCKDGSTYGSVCTC